ncbi:uncharacterized protein LOC132302424 isoform X1 [Cornus florida]|uniref:uncharacterized protein LOC132302424 isoform X1 n=1 Tax=Cornus florida TaxID=4283 RepID=UPI0028A007F1|nr:uncharacterized protein LOC132302424 isoform X1 [Cornus florida]XP_059655263.1 uncharacterized protein LOC132302424 isoform X1 [Cornus florida]XP_059655264.1 uncharacterized protein LOC132302424 isoform X1 [Cornus florida]XP_059655265.1 uncharacterized protein LOC132302424 isoform X1 [Cornus florida]XP_059655266.1 uncharacterized protein LOC132302424 isoform X1 [Cornus florida]
MTKSMLRTVLAFKDGTIPLVPPKSEWRRAPYLEDHDMFWNSIEHYCFDPDVAENPLLMGPEEKSDIVKVVPSSIPRLLIERGDCPYSFFDHASHVVTSVDWELWCNHILKKHLATLAKAEILHAIVLFSFLSIKRDLVSLNVLFSRWSSVHHTFLTPWGEFSPTIEDVAVLYRLPICGSQPIATLGSSKEDQDITAYLEKCAKEAMKQGTWFKGSTRLKKQSKVASPKLTYACWFRYFYKDLENVKKTRISGRSRQNVHGPEYNKQYELAGFLAYWLDRYIFEGRPEDGLSREVFPLAAVLSRGISLPLAPMFLGTLYDRLDTVVSDCIRSVGRYDISTFASSMFLSVFLFERFPNYGPCPLELNDTDKNGYPTDYGHASRWMNLGSMNKNIGDFIDQENEFIFRPYTTERKGIKRPSFYFEEYQVLTRDEQLTPTQLMFAVIVAGLPLPVFGDLPMRVTSYSPMRVARQLGFDQGIPRSPISTEDETLCNLVNRFKEDGELKFEIPSMSRVGKITSSYMGFLEETHMRIKEFVLSDPVICTEVKVFNNDASLKCPVPRGVRGKPCRFAKSDVPCSRKRAVHIDNVEEQEFESFASDNESIARRGLRVRAKTVNYAEISGSVEEESVRKGSKPMFLSIEETHGICTDKAVDEERTVMEVTETEARGVSQQNHVERETEVLEMERTTDAADAVSVLLTLQSSTHHEKEITHAKEVREQEKSTLENIDENVRIEYVAPIDGETFNIQDQGVGHDFALNFSQDSGSNLIGELWFSSPDSETRAMINEFTVGGDVATEYQAAMSDAPRLNVQIFGGPSSHEPMETLPATSVESVRVQVEEPSIIHVQTLSDSSHDVETCLNPITCNPGDTVKWQSFFCSFRSVQMLSRILQLHPQTFVNFHVQDPEFQRVFLDALADFLIVLDGKILGDIDESIVNKVRGRVADWRGMGLEVSWLENRLADVLSSSEVSKMENSYAQLMARQEYVDSEVKKAQVYLSDLEKENTQLKEKIAKISFDLVQRKRDPPVLASDLFFKTIL